MKLTTLARATLVVSALFATLTSIHAQVPIDPDITVGSGYSASAYYGDPSSNTITGFTWDASNNLYYLSAHPDFSFGGFYKVNSSLTSSTNYTPTDLASGAFAGSTVTGIGSYMYFNDSNGNIYSYALGGSSSSKTASMANYALFGNSGLLYVTGAGSSTANQISFSHLDPTTGALLNNPSTQIEADGGNSGPLAFDSSGNLFYAPGFGSTKIYEWSSAQVAVALAGTTPLTETSGSLWLDYSLTAYGSYFGGTGLTVDGDQLLITLTSLSGPSALVSFGINSDGSAGFGATLLSNDGTDFTFLNQVQVNNGNIYVSDSNQIIEVAVVPEPSTIILVLAGFGVLVWFQRRRSLRLAPAALTAAIVFFSIKTAAAGPFSPAADQPGSTGIAADSSSIQEWANSVVNFSPGPVDIATPTGTLASFGSSSNALGPSDSTQTNPNNVVSLGDGGSITLSFATPITNGSGADFAVYENGFPQSGVPNAYFLELATVSVSSDGVHFFTFPSVSLSPTSSQIASFGTLDPTNLYNLAGSEIVGYGTPFNLDDLSSITSPQLNINAITEIRVTDVIGRIDTSLGTGTYTMDDATNPIFNGLYGTTDHIINDPYNTPFTSGGFDLDAIGVLNVAPEPASLRYLLLGLVVVALHFHLRRRIHS